PAREVLRGTTEPDLVGKLGEEAERQLMVVAELEVLGRAIVGGLLRAEDPRVAGKAFQAVRDLELAPGLDAVERDIADVLILAASLGRGEANARDLVVDLLVEEVDVQVEVLVLVRRGEIERRALFRLE